MTEKSNRKTGTEANKYIYIYIKFTKGEKITQKTFEKTSKNKTLNSLSFRFPSGVPGLAKSFFKMQISFNMTKKKSFPNPIILLNFCQGGCKKYNCSFQNFHINYMSAYS